RRARSPRGSPAGWQRAAGRCSLRRMIAQGRRGPSARGERRAGRSARGAGGTLGPMPAPTVLIVEDDAAIADAMAYHLDKAGFRPLLASDGGQGLRLFRQQRPDLVILDLMLPQVDGWRFTEQLRGEDAQVPLIVCSARTSEHDRVHGLELGADDYVTKPFSM